MTTSLELSKRLFKLSGWADTEKIYGHIHNRLGEYLTTDVTDPGTAEMIAPAYSLGYLIRKLPPGVFMAKGKRFRVWFAETDNPYEWEQSKDANLDAYDADTPEDALCLLAIRLFEEGILKKEEAK